MDIQLEKIELTKLLLETNNPSIIQSIKEIFQKAEKNDFWEELTTEQQVEIEKASLQVEQGKTVSYDSFMKQHR